MQTTQTAPVDGVATAPNRQRGRTSAPPLPRLFAVSATTAQLAAAVMAHSTRVEDVLASSGSSPPLLAALYVLGRNAGRGDAVCGGQSYQVGDVAEVSSRTRELAERFEARLTAAGSNQVREDALAFFGPLPSFAPLTQGET